MFLRSRQAKLADFGLVREMNDTMGVTTSLMGTPGYMDPAITDPGVFVVKIFDPLVEYWMEELMGWNPTPA